MMSYWSSPEFQNLTKILILAERPEYPDQFALFRSEIDPPQPPQLVFKVFSKILMLLRWLFTFIVPVFIESLKNILFFVFFQFLPPIYGGSLILFAHFQ